MLVFFFFFVFSFVFSFLFLKFFWLSFALKHKITGKDIHKPEKPEIPESGGIVIIVSLFFSFLLAILLKMLFPQALSFFEIKYALPVFSSLLIISLIGFFDDLNEKKQRQKVLLSFLAAIPLMSLSIKNPIWLPFFGSINLGIFYSLFLIPLGVVGASNAFDMLAGFNGLESGLAVLIIFTLSLVAWELNHLFVFFVLLISLAGFLSLWLLNKYPAKVFCGDVGTMVAGNLIAISVILGNFEWAGIILMIPFFLDCAIKIPHKLPSKGWFGEYKKGKLFCPFRRPITLCQLIMKISGGISEKNLVLVILLFETICCLAVLKIYLFH